MINTILKMITWNCYILAIIAIVAQVNGENPTSIHCEATRQNITSTRKDSLFFQKSIPLVIGHRGNPMKFQENTLAGFKSLLDLNVDGFETDILLTKDKKLVLFHDTDTSKLTGENHNINQLTYKEIQKLNIKKHLTYGHEVYNYTKTEKIPLLEDLIREMKDSGLLMILEMKPSDPPYDLDLSRETGIEVAKMVKRYGVEKQVILSSFDTFKLYHARKNVGELNVCFLVTKKYWDQENFLTNSMVDLENLDGLQDCFENLTKSDYGSFVLESTGVVKAIGASALDMDYEIYNNPNYSNNTFEMFKKNYGKTFSYGAWTVYKMKFDEKELDDSEDAITMLIENGVGRLYTDDAPRLLKKLGRPVMKNFGLTPFCSILNCAVVLFLTFVLAV